MVFKLVSMDINLRYETMKLMQELSLHQRLITNKAKFGRAGLLTATSAARSLPALPVI